MALKIKYGAVQIVVGRGTVRDNLHAQVIRARLAEQQDKGEEYTLYTLFSDLCTHCRKASGLPYDPLIVHTLPADKIREAYEAFLGLDNKFKDLWIGAMTRADQPADEIIGPEELPDGADPLP